MINLKPSQESQMRQFISWLLAVVLFVSSLPLTTKAEMAPDILNVMGVEYGSKISRKIPMMAQSVSVKAQDVLAHQGQALLLIMILSGVGLVQQHVSDSLLRKKAIDMDLLLEHAGVAADHILSSGEIWSSLAGAGALSAISAKPLALMNQIIANSTSKPILKNLLQSGIATFITFLGWEIGGHLYTEAAEMIENKEDSARAQRLIPLLMNSLSRQVSPEDTQYQKDWLLLKQVFRNMATILIHDHDLRNMWLYNTWRNRIATGEFVALVTAMTGASVLGSMIFPGAGTLLGMIFGVAGGLLVLFVPEEQKDRITSAIQSVRLRFWRTGDERGSLFSVNKSIIRIAYEHVSAGRELPPLLKFAPNPLAGEMMADVLIERIFRFDSRLQLLRSKRNIAESSGNVESTRELVLRIQEITKYYRNELIDLSQLYSSELDNLDQNLKMYPILAGASEKMLSRYPIVQHIFEYRKRLVKISNFFNFFASTINTALNSENLDYLPALNRLFIFGMSEKMLLEFIVQ